MQGYRPQDTISSENDTTIARPIAVDTWRAWPKLDAVRPANAARYRWVREWGGLTCYGSHRYAWPLRSLVAGPHVPFRSIWFSDEAIVGLALARHHDGVLRVHRRFVSPQSRTGPMPLKRSRLSWTVTWTEAEVARA